jgi:hypothetical protein
MMMRVLLAAAFVCACSHHALAHHFRFTANLTGPAESPPNGSAGFGHAVITLDVDEGIMEIQTSFQGLMGPVTAAHIHASTAVSGSGTADIATQLPSLAGFATGVDESDYEHAFDLNQAETYNPTFFAASGGTTGDALGAFFNALQAGKAYFDIHTEAFSDGEIRGFLSRVPGDYNDNGIVDAADYALWRKTVGNTGEGLKADSNNDNVINDEDYTAWRQNFGHSGLSTPPGSGTAFLTSIPEPSTVALVAIWLLAPLRRSRPA